MQASWVVMTGKWSQTGDADLLSQQQLQSLMERLM
jgi:hypothetical protein